MMVRPINEDGNVIRESASESSFLPKWALVIPFAIAGLFWETLQSAPSDASKRIVWYAVLIIAGAGVLTWVCRASKEFDLFEPLYLVFGLFVLFYPLRALFAVWLDESWFDPHKSAGWTALSGSALGFACFALGYKLVQRKPSQNGRIWLDETWNKGRANLVGAGFLVIGIAGFIAVRLLGGSFLYFVSLDSDIKSPESITAWFFYLLWACVFLQLGALVQLGGYFSGQRGAAWTILYCAMALLSSFLLSRYFTVLFVLMLAISWHYQRRRVKPLQVVAVFFLLLAYLGLAGLYREWIAPGFNLDEAAGLGELAGQQGKLVLRYVVHDLEQLSNLSEVVSMTPSAVPYQLGSTFTPVLFKPVPRTLMPTKPLGASALFSREVIPELYDNGFVTGVGGWAEWYLNFSWAGLVFGMALTGALTGAAYRAMGATGEFSRVLLYLSFVAALFTWLRNDFNSASTFGLYYFIPAILALAYITRAEWPNGRVKRLIQA